MHALKKRDFRLVAGFHQCVEGRLDQFRDTPAKHALFAKEVRFRLFLKGRFDQPGAGRADAFAVSHGRLPRLTAGILMNGEQRGNSSAPDVLAPDQMPWAFRGHHHDIGFGRRKDLPVMNIETVRKKQGLAGFHVGGDVLAVELRLHMVLGQDLNHVGRGGGLTGGYGLKAVFNRFFIIGGTRPLPHNHIDAAVAQVLRLRVPLAAIADDSDFFTPKNIQIRIRIVVHPHCIPPSRGKAVKPLSQI